MAKRDFLDAIYLLDRLRGMPADWHDSKSEFVYGFRDIDIGEYLALSLSDSAEADENELKRMFQKDFSEVRHKVQRGGEERYERVFCTFLIVTHSALFNRSQPSKNTVIESLGSVSLDEVKRILSVSMRLPHATWTEVNRYVDGDIDMHLIDTMISQ